MPPKPLRQPTRKEAVALPQNARFTYLSQVSHLLASDGYLDDAAYFGSQALKASGSQGAAVPRRSALQHCEVCGVFLSPSSCTSIECVDLSRRSQLRAAAAAASTAATSAPSSGGGKGPNNVVAIVRACRVCGHRNSQPFAAAHVARQMAESEARALEQVNMERKKQEQQEHSQEASPSDQLQQQPEPQLLQLRAELHQQPEGQDTDQEAYSGNQGEFGAEAVISSDEPAATTTALDTAVPAVETTVVPDASQDVTGGTAVGTTVAVTSDTAAAAGTSAEPAGGGSGSADAEETSPVAEKGSAVTTRIGGDIQKAHEDLLADEIRVPSPAANGAIGVEEALGGDAMEAAQNGLKMEAAAIAAVAADATSPRRTAREVVDTENAVDSASDPPPPGVSGSDGDDGANPSGAVATVGATYATDTGIIEAVKAAAGSVPERAAGAEGEPAVWAQAQITDTADAAAATAHSEADVEGASRLPGGAGLTQPDSTLAAMEVEPKVEGAPGHHMPLPQALVAEIEKDEQHHHQQQPVALADGDDANALRATVPPAPPAPGEAGGDKGDAAMEVVVVESPERTSKRFGVGLDAPEGCAAAPSAAPADVAEAIATCQSEGDARSDGTAGEAVAMMAVPQNDVAVTEAGGDEDMEEQQSEEEEESSGRQPEEPEAARGGGEDELAAGAEEKPPAAVIVVDEPEGAVEISVQTAPVSPAALGAQGGDEAATAAAGSAAGDAIGASGKATAAFTGGAHGDIDGDACATVAGDVPVASSVEAAEADGHLGRRLAGAEEQQQQVVVVVMSSEEEGIGGTEEEEQEASSEAAVEEEGKHSREDGAEEKGGDTNAGEGVDVNEEESEEEEAAAAERITAGPTTAVAAAVEKGTEIVDLVSEDGEEAAAETFAVEIAATAALPRRASLPPLALATEARQAAEVEAEAGGAPEQQQQQQPAVGAAALPPPEAVVTDLESQGPAGRTEAGGQVEVEEAIEVSSDGGESQEEEEEEEEDKGGGSLIWDAAFGISSGEDESEESVESDEEDDGEEEEKQQARMPVMVFSKAIGAVAPPKPAALLKPSTVQLPPATVAKTVAAAAAAATTEVAEGEATATTVDTDGGAAAAAFEAAAAPSTVKRRRVQPQELEPQPAAQQVLVRHMAQEPQPHELPPPLQETTALAGKKSNAKKDKAKSCQRAAEPPHEQKEHEQQGSRGRRTEAVGGKVGGRGGEKGTSAAAVLAVPACQAAAASVQSRADRSAPRLFRGGTAVVRHGEQLLSEAPAAVVRMRQQKKQQQQSREQQLQQQEEEEAEEQPRRKRPRGYPGWLPEGYVSETSILPLLPKEREDGVLVYEAPYAQGLFDLRPIVELEWPRVLHHPRHRRRILRDSALFSAHHARFTAEQQRQIQQKQKQQQPLQQLRQGAVMDPSTPVGRSQSQPRAAEPCRQVAAAAASNGGYDNGGGRRPGSAVEVVSAGDRGGSATAAPRAKAVFTMPAPGRGGATQSGAEAKQQLRLGMQQADRVGQQQQQQQQGRLWQELEINEEDEEDDEEDDEEGASSSGDEDDDGLGARVPRIGPWAKLPPWDSSTLNSGAEEEEEEGPVLGVTGIKDGVDRGRRRSLAQEAPAAVSAGRTTVTGKRKKEELQWQPQQQPQCQGQLVREPLPKEAGGKRKHVQWGEKACGKKQQQPAQQQHSQQLRAKKQRR